MTVLVLGIAMALPLGLYLTLSNLSTIDLKRDDWGAISVFLSVESAEDQAIALAQQIDERQDASAATVSPGQGMDEFRTASGFGQAIDLFETNPLPWVILVTPQPVAGVDLDDHVKMLVAWLTEQELVEMVQVDYKWMQRLTSLLGLGDAIVTVLSVLFSLAVVVVVANTIRLDVANRAEEIQVLSLVGAGDGFIRQPFLYIGIWYGVLGAVLALMLLSLSFLYLRNPLEHLLHAYGNSFQLKGLRGREAGLVLLAGGLLGFGGAWISVQRYLRQLRDGGLLSRI